MPSSTRCVVPSAAILQHRYALISALGAQGFSIRSAEDGKPRAGDIILVADGEPVPASAGAVIIANDGSYVRPARDGGPARIAFTASEAALGHGFVRALIVGAEAPTAADPESLAVCALADRIAAVDITVLIHGPTGSGKEVLARHIHRSSVRRHRPFIAINCAALPETMLEALLFGHQMGALTGTASGGEGLFRAANGGTLLLDEIDEVPLHLQAKLLRVLQQREVVPIGAATPEAIDVRLIACTQRDLQAEAARGRFRADLYYRLAVFPLATRPLTERRQDIPALVAAMILRHGGARPVVPWPDAEAVDALVAHDWPGNVRELENVVQRALLLSGGETISIAHIVFDRPNPASPHLSANQPVTLGNIVNMRELQAIRETLAACGGSRIETAKRLGISERTLRYRLAKAREQGDDLARSGQSQAAFA